MDQKADLTTGGIMQKLVYVALPIMGTQLMQMLYNLTDMFWLGRLSSDAVAASGTSGMYMWLSMALLLIGRTGAEIGVSQNKGRGDPETAKAFAQNAWLLSLAFGLCYAAALTLFSGPLMSVFHIRESMVVEAAQGYLQIIGLGIPATCMSAVYTGTFNGSGNSRVPFLMNAVGLIMNMILDPLMIFSLHLGIRGAALATIIAQWAVNILLFYAIHKHKDRPFERFTVWDKPNLIKIRQIFRWSIPLAVESIFFTSLSMMVTRVVSGFGADALAVQRVGLQIESLSWLIGGGFGSAMTAFVGQNYGAGEWKRIEKGFHAASLTMLVWGAFVMLILFFNGHALYSLFLAEDRLRFMGAAYMRILAVGQIPGSLEGIGGGYFRGTGNTMPSSASSIACNLIRVPLCVWLAATSLGISGV
ncbi:MAG: MATE family efflux transporter, partial [Clostridiales bacterium]|nr:MATE family efflux transporter [Clostridiales bacterium]